MLIKRVPFRFGGHVIHLMQLGLWILAFIFLDHPMYRLLFASLACTLLFVDRLYIAPRIRLWADELLSRLQHSLNSDNAAAAKKLVRQYAWLRFFGRQAVLFHALGELSFAQQHYEDAIFYFHKATSDGERSSRINASFGALKAAKAIGDPETIAKCLEKLCQNEPLDALTKARLERLENESWLR